ncbi:hypothetical protein AB0L13_40490 [Saccharopolyspora shandongensis]|uniref:hypothetical protein n=1 Tax=Saccharopolyspora shandongensis TaxID=418495 RepID=UPI00343E1F3B
MAATVAEPVGVLVSRTALRLGLARFRAERADDRVGGALHGVDDVGRQVLKVGPAVAAVAGERTGGR